MGPSQSKIWCLWCKGTLNSIQLTTDVKKKVCLHIETQPPNLTLESPSLLISQKTEEVKTLNPQFNQLSGNWSY